MAATELAGKEQRNQEQGRASIFDLGRVQGEGTERQSFFCSPEIFKRDADRPRSFSRAAFRQRYKNLNTDCFVIQSETREQFHIGSSFVFVFVFFIFLLLLLLFYCLFNLV